MSWNDKETYNEAIGVYTLKPENRKDIPRYKDTKMIRVVDRIETRKKYTEPFKPETAQRLWDMKNGKCNLVLIDEFTDHPGFGGLPFESFKNSTFQELWDMLATPKIKTDHNYGYNLENSHIG